MKCKMCEVLQPFRKRRKPLARVGCGELGVRARLRDSHCPGATSAAAPPAQGGGSLCGHGCCLQAGHGPHGPLPFPTPHCAPLWSGEDREPELSLFPSLFPSSAIVLFPRMSQSPCGQSPLPPGSLHCLSVSSHPPGCSEQAHPRTWDTRSSLAVLLPAPAAPAGAQPVAGGERDSRPLFLSTTGELG